MGKGIRAQFRNEFTAWRLRMLLPECWSQGSPYLITSDMLSYDRVAIRFMGTPFPAVRHTQPTLVGTNARLLCQRSRTSIFISSRAVVFRKLRVIEFNDEPRPDLMVLCLSALAKRTEDVGDDWELREPRRIYQREWVPCKV